MFSFLFLQVFQLCRLLLFWKNKFFWNFTFCIEVGFDFTFCIIFIFSISLSFPRYFSDFLQKIIFHAKNYFVPAIPPIDFFSLVFFCRPPLVCAVRRRSDGVPLRWLVCPPYKGSGLLIFSAGLGAGRCLGWGWVLLRFAVFARPTPGRVFLLAPAPALAVCGLGLCR